MRGRTALMPARHEPGGCPYWPGRLVPIQPYVPTRDAQMEPDPLQAVLPLRLGVRPDDGLLALPQLSIVDVTRRLTGSLHGRDRVRSLLAYRETLGLLGLTSGFQWLMGPPAASPAREPLRGARRTDVDVVTFCRRPPRASADAAWHRFVDANQPLLDPNRVWTGFGCRAYFVDLGLAPEAVVAHTRFWFDLLTRQRHELGLDLLEAPLGPAEDDVAASLVTWS